MKTTKIKVNRSIFKEKRPDLLWQKGEHICKSKTFGKRESK
jgi:hypothetical protein